MRHWIGSLFQSLKGIHARGFGILLLGLIIPQLIICGPCFFGGRVLLPLDILSGFYDARVFQAHDPSLADMVFAFEPWRHFYANEMAAGRLPLWDPNVFAGVPFCFPSYSPYNLIYALWPSPHCLVWIQLLKVLVAGVGIYLFMRRAVGVGFWPAVIVAWCLPLTGFYTVWQGFYATCTVSFLPWLLLATHRAICGSRRGGILLAVITALTLTSGQIDIALQSMLISGLYALWLLATRLQSGLASRIRRTLMVIGGWVVGFMLAAPFLLPLKDYINTGIRMTERAEGFVARPPVGITALPQLLIPEIYGLSQAGWVYLGALNVPESAASGYTGVIVTLFLVPLAWCCRDKRREFWFWLGIVVFTLSWTLNISGFVSLLRLPVLNMMSFNRFTFATNFALLVLAGMGMDAIRKRLESGDKQTANPVRHWGFVIPILMLVALLTVCMWSWWKFPPETLLKSGLSAKHMEVILENFQGAYLKGIIYSLLGLVCWIFVLAGNGYRRWNAPLLLTVMLVEYLSFAVPFSPRGDPGLYYPDRPLLSFLREKSDRVMGVSDWLPNILVMHGLRDIRGYDGIDPVRIVQVMQIGEDTEKSRSPSWARTQRYVPIMDYTKEGQIRLHPVLNMMNVRWLLFRGSSSELRPVFKDHNCEVIENVAALPRAFVPTNIEPAPGEDSTLALMMSKDFDPAAVSYNDGMLKITDAKGKAEVISEVSDRVTVKAEMETPGMVVLADHWYAGWRAWVNGKEMPIHRVNHVLRGVEVPAGVSTIEYRFDPLNFRIGVWLTLSGIVILAAWGIFCRKPDLTPVDVSV